jgi:hypothetical protein
MAFVLAGSWAPPSHAGTGTGGGRGFSSDARTRGQTCPEGEVGFLPDAQTAGEKAPCKPDGWDAAMAPGSRAWSFVDDRSSAATIHGVRALMHAKETLGFSAELLPDGQLSRLKVTGDAIASTDVVGRAAVLGHVRAGFDTHATSVDVEGSVALTESGPEAQSNVSINVICEHAAERR